MRLSQIRSFLPASIFLLAFIGCAVNRLDLTMVDNRESPVSLTMPFPSLEFEVIYKAQIDISGQFYSGILAISRMTEKNVRIAFINELGMKFFEVEISGNKLIVNHAIEPFQRKGVINLVEEMFNTLFFIELPEKLEEGLMDESREYTVYPVDRNGKLFYFMSNATGQCKRIEKIGWFTRKLTIQLEYDAKLPKYIRTSFPGKNTEIILTSF